MNQPSETQLQQQLVQTPEGQRVVRRHIFRHVLFALGLIMGLGLFFLWLPAALRGLLIHRLAQNQLLIALLILFGSITSSLLWSAGQRLDIWLFQVLNLRGYHTVWMDRAMWVSTQIGNLGFAILLAAAAFVLGYHRFAVGLMLGSLVLTLVVTIIKIWTDRVRPFNLLRETRVTGWREPGLSFPSGHTAQTFFLIILTITHFQLPFLAAFVLYAIAILVAFTRVYLGVHYPRDVIAGGILGMICGNLSTVLLP